VNTVGQDQWLFFLWTTSFLISVWIGLKKGEALAMGFLALVFGPLAIPVAILSRGHKLPCPYCATKIPAKAIYCKHCHHEVVR
jgi:hypothetical protein